VPLLTEKVLLAFQREFPTFEGQVVRRRSKDPAENERPERLRSIAEPPRVGSRMENAAVIVGIVTVVGGKSKRCGPLPSCFEKSVLAISRPFSVGSTDMGSVKCSHELHRCGRSPKQRGGRREWHDSGSMVLE